MKVKIIYGEYVDRFENEINEFIKDKYVYDIKFPYSKIIPRVLIMYDEELEEPMAVQHVKGE